MWKPHVWNGHSRIMVPGPPCAILLAALRPAPYLAASRSERGDANGFRIQRPASEHRRAAQRLRHRRVLVVYGGDLFLELVARLQPRPLRLGTALGARRGAARCGRHCGHVRNVVAPLTRTRALITYAPATDPAAATRRRPGCDGTAPPTRRTSADPAAR